MNPSLNDLGMLAMTFIGCAAGVVYGWAKRKELVEENRRLRWELARRRGEPSRLRVVGGDMPEITRAVNMRMHPSQRNRGLR